MVYAVLTLSNLQLICTVTPSSSSSEETHNTLKFAHRAKHIEIQAAQNKVSFIFLFLLFQAFLFSKLSPSIYGRSNFVVLADN